MYRHAQLKPGASKYRGFREGAALYDPIRARTTRARKIAVAGPSAAGRTGAAVAVRRAQPARRASKRTLLPHVPVVQGPQGAQAVSTTECGS